MTRFLRNIAILAIPFILYLLVIAIVDPFSYLKREGWIDPQRKRYIPAEVSPHLTRIIEYRNNPRPNLLLGDSRSVNLYRCMDQDRWASLAFEGGSLKEFIQAFDWVTREYTLDTVLIQVNLNHYNKYNRRFHVEQTLESTKNFFSYAVDRSVLRATYLIVKDSFSEKSVSMQDPGMTKDEFWEHHLSTVPRKFFSQFSYPEEYYKELKRIADFCTSKNVVLIFWVSPCHTDFQKIVNEYVDEEAMEQMLTDLSALAEVYFYDYPGELTEDRDNFRDPVHFTQDVAARIRDEILKGEPFAAKRLKNEP